MIISTGGTEPWKAKLGTPDGRVARVTYGRRHRESSNPEARPCSRGSQEASRARGETVPTYFILHSFNIRYEILGPTNPHYTLI